MDLFEKAAVIFKTCPPLDNPIYLPDQLFNNLTFDFLLTIGHYPVEDENEYNRFIGLLKEIGEDEFYVLENAAKAFKGTIKGVLGYPTEVDFKPFTARFSINTTFNEFDAVLQSYDPPVGFSINDFFMFGNNTNWGVYLAESPSINVIGCTNNLSAKFSEVFKIKGNGYQALDSFITQEYWLRPEAREALIKNYNIR